MWAVRKVLWKIFLTPYSQREDAAEIQDLRDQISRFDVPVPIYTFDEDKNQFTAMRNDAAALLTAYGDFLKNGLVPGYQNKPENGGLANMMGDPKILAPLIERERGKVAEYTKNHLDNLEQNAFQRSLRALRFSATDFVIHNFCWPPDDDQTVNEILDDFPPISEPREQILSELALSRPARLKELKIDVVQAKRK